MELQAFAGLVFYLQSDWVVPWNRLVLASDASETGWALARSWWNLNDVKAAGRIRERDRFRLASVVGARASAFKAAGLEEESDGTWIKVGSDGVWEQDAQFPEVDWRQLGAGKWEKVTSGSWRYEFETITIREARALLHAVERIGHSRYGFGVRQLVLVDNLGVALSFTRCRAKNKMLLYLVRRSCAIRLGCNLLLSVRWIPSEFNSSDEGSREFNVIGSKSLTHLLEPEPGENDEKSVRLTVVCRLIVAMVMVMMGMRLMMMLIHSVSNIRDPLIIFLMFPVIMPTKTVII